MKPRHRRVHRRMTEVPLRCAIVSFAGGNFDLVSPCAHPAIAYLIGPHGLAPTVYGSGPLGRKRTRSLTVCRDHALAFAFADCRVKPIKGPLMVTPS